MFFWDEALKLQDILHQFRISRPTSPPMTKCRVPQINLLIGFSWFRKVCSLMKYYKEILQRMQKNPILCANVFARFSKAYIFEFAAWLASRHFWDKKWSPLRTKALQKLQTKAEETESRGFSALSTSCITFTLNHFDKICFTLQKNYAILCNFHHTDLVLWTIRLLSLPSC